MEWTGGCLCGAVRYRAAGAPERVAHCHCGMCRRVSGAPFITAAAFAQTTFAWTKGEPAVYRSSAEAERGFCARCGSTLSFRFFASHDWIYVFVGSLDRPQDVVPADHIFTATQLPWIHLDDSLPRFPAGRFEGSARPTD